MRFQMQLYDILLHVNNPQRLQYNILLHVMLLQMQLYYDLLYVNFHHLQ